MAVRHDGMVGAPRLGPDCWERLSAAHGVVAVRRDNYPATATGCRRCYGVYVRYK
jgi:hypothetical protein